MADFAIAASGHNRQHESHHASLSVAGVASMLHRDNGSPFFSLAVFGSGSIQVFEESVAAAEGDDELNKSWKCCASGASRAFSDLWRS
ncbi:hypothetical protein QFZ94_008009 [Paraburkholderia sp. JPY465]|uniref:hypothetical protein n=1 Tax=Paraburkholderia sp. JPY465 TaxID=3042285 RepID=UPI003D1E7FB4